MGDNDVEIKDYVDARVDALVREVEVLRDQGTRNADAAAKVQHEANNLRGLMLSREEAQTMREDTDRRIGELTERLRDMLPTRLWERGHTDVVDRIGKLERGESANRGIADWLRWAIPAGVALIGLLVLLSNYLTAHTH